MFRSVHIEAPEQIAEHLTEVDELVNRSPSVWVFPNILRREQRYFKLNQTIQGPAQRLAAFSRHRVENMTCLEPGATALVSVDIDAYEHEAPRAHTLFAVETPNIALSEEDYKIIAIRGVWEFLSGTRTTQDQKDVDIYESTRSDEDAQLRAFLEQGRIKLNR